MKVKKRFLSILLSLVMVVGLMPGMSLTALADDEVTIATTWEGVQAVFTSGGTVKLGADITAGAEDKALTVGSGKTVILDLNGHVLSRGLTEDASENAITSLSKGKASGYVINTGTTSTNSLTIKDSSPNTEHTVTVYTHRFNGSTLNTYASEQTVYGGVITGGNNTGSTYTYGGGICYNAGSLTIEGGTICGNASTKDGGGVYVGSGTLTITGGTISGNLALGGYGVSARLSRPRTALLD